MAARIDHHRLQKWPASPGTIQTKNTNTEKNEKMYTPSQPKTTAGWRFPNLTFSTTPIYPDLDTHPTHRYELTQHPTLNTHTTLHRPDGTTICTIENRRLNKLHDIYKHERTNPLFAESLTKLIQIHTTQHNLKKVQRKLQLAKSKSAPETQPFLCGGWPTPDKLYDTLDACFDVDRILHCNPYNLPLRAQAYYSEDPLNNRFSSEPLTYTAWTGTSMSLPEFSP
jgi:hypothetical protein